jgi:glycosyltransferase involved in cell wall biosynthesis
MKPKISVVIPAYNHARFLEASISSVLANSYQNLELIVVNDGSTDNTREIIEKFPNVIAIHQDNQGAHAAINIGCLASSGEFLAILNDDDIYGENHLEIAVKYLEKELCDLFIGSPKIFGTGEKVEPVKFHVRKSKDLISEIGFQKSLFQLNWALSTSALVFRKDLFFYLGGFRNFRMSHDVDFLFRTLAISKKRVCVSSQKTWSYRCHENNSGSKISIESQQLEMAYIICETLTNIFQGDLDIDAVQSIIGYGINRELLDKTLKEKPWESNILNSESPFKSA